MKSLIAIVVGAIGLAGCVAVPVGGYPEPAYGPGYYYGAPAYYGPSFSFGYSHHGHGHGHRHRRYR